MTLKRLRKLVQNFNRDNMLEIAELKDWLY